MFHTLFDYQDQNIPNNKQLPKNKSNGFFKKTSKDQNSQQNYYGKGNHAYDLYNKNNNEDEDDDNSQNSIDSSEQFEKTKNKVKLIVYKNGFILNNGPFRDTFIAKNREFLEQVERGVIPRELLEKGISDLGILLINRKTETYRSHNSNNHNTFDHYDFFKNPYQNVQQNNNYNNDNFNYNSNNNANNYNYNNNKYKKSNNIIPIGMQRVNSSKNMQLPRKIDLTKFKDKKITKKNCSEPKKKENKEEKSKFRAFSGAGKLIKNVNIQGLHVNKDLKTVVDVYQPVCTESIRLFNGDVAKCEFNYCQTLRDIYFHVRRISGSNNFYLLDGFPPRPLRDYDRTIYELGLQNSMLTQRIN
jgi:hypothetical protein